MQHNLAHVMKESIILQILEEQKEETTSISYEKWTDRYEESQFEWESTLAQVVIGVRRCGKSTLCHKVLLQHGCTYGYVNFDDDRLADLHTEDLNTLLNCLYQLYGTEIKYLFFDEIQNVDGWHLFVNRLLRQGFHVFLTGSNARLLSSELSTHLTGRYNEIRLYPFSYRETCQYKGISTASRTTKADASRKATLTAYLHEGGMPELSNIRLPQNRLSYVEGVFETIITKDIVGRYKLHHSESLRRIAHHLTNNFCQEISTSALAEISGLKSEKTIQKYVSYLSQAFLIIRLQKFSFKRRERIHNEKAYSIDLGLNDNRSNALLPENAGWRLENVVLIELLRRHRSMADDLYYYKPTSRSKEVDFVICHRGIVEELIQVAYDIDNAKTFRRETESLTNASDKLNCKNLTLISYTETRDIDVHGHTIHLYNIIDWLLAVGNL